MRIVPDLVDVSRPDALLVVNETVSSGMVTAEQVGDEGMHPGCGEQHGGIVLGHERRARDGGVTAILEVVDVHRA